MTTTVSLGEVAAIERTGVDPKELDPETRYLGLEHIERGGRIIGHDTVGEAEIASTKFRFTASHVLFGKLRPNLGKIARPDFDGVSSTDILPIRPGPRLDRDYLTHYLRQPSIVEYAATRTTGANLPRLSPNTLAAFEIPLPPIAEQRRIAAILDQADALRAKRRQVLARLDDLTQSTFHATFSNAQTESVSLRDAIKWSSGKFLPAKEQSGGPYPVYGGNGINGGHEDFMFAAPRLIAGRVGAYCGAVHVTRPNSWVTDNALIGTLLVDDLTLDYLLPALKVANLNQYAATSGQPSISAARIGDVTIPRPPLDVQLAFAARLAAINAQRAVVEHALAADDELFASVQSRAFRGEL